MKKQKSLLTVISFIILLGLQLAVIAVLGQAPGPRQTPSLPMIPIKGDTTHSLSTHFTPSSNIKKAPDSKRFIQRWIVLEPVRKDIARNNILTESYLRTTFSTDNSSTEYAAVPKNGEQVKVGDQHLKWYALDSKAFNFNLYHFTYALNEPPYGVLFWLVTVINCPEEIKNVRIAGLELTVDLTRMAGGMRGATRNNDEPVKPVPAQTLDSVSKSWPSGNIEVRIGDYLSRPSQKWTVTAAPDTAGYLGGHYYKILLAGNNRALAATAEAEVITVPAFSNAPEQLCRIEQLTDGTYRIMPKVVPNSTKPLALVSIGDSRPTLAAFDMNSDNSKWNFKAH